MQVQAGPYTIALREPRGEAALRLSGRIGAAIDAIGMIDLMTPQVERAYLLMQDPDAKPDPASEAAARAVLAKLCTRVGGIDDATGLAAMCFDGATISGPDIAPTIVDRRVICEVFGRADKARHLWPAVLSSWFVLGFFGGGATSESAAPSPPNPTAPPGHV